MLAIFQLTLLRLGDFRWLGTSVLLNAVGMMGENVVLGWLTLELTNSPLMVGAALGMRMLPLFFVGVPAGALADRFARHRLLMLSGAGQALTAATLGTLTLVGTVGVAEVFVLTLAAGTFRGVEHAARQSYTHDVVGAGALVNGLAILGVAMRVGWLLGSLTIGAVIARHGAGVAYLVVALGFLAGALAVLPVTAPPRATSAAPAVWRSALDFLLALRRDRTLVVLMMLTAGAEILGFAHQAVLPSLARDVLHAGPEGLGALSAARSVGGILGLTVASAGHAAAGARFMVTLGAFGVGLMVLGGAPYVVGFGGVLLVLVAVNAVGALADLFAQTLLQLSVPQALRGRAGGAWVVAIGLAPLGQLQIGALASLFGVSVALAISGAALTILAVATTAAFPRVKRV